MKNKIILYNNDCLSILPNFDDKSINLILTDLPYGKLANKTRAKWDNTFNYTKLFEEYRRLIKPNGAIILFGNEPFSSYVRCNLLDIYKYDIKWVKGKTTGFANANYRPMNKYEDIMICSYANASSGGKKNPMTYNPQGLKPVYKKKKNHINRQGLVSYDTNNLGEDNMLNQETEYIQKYTNYPTNVVFFNNPKKYLHPTQKPVPLLEYLIKTYSNPNDLALDTCMGSGSTGVACQNTGRRFIGIELDEKYYNIAKDRLKEYNSQTRLI